MELIQFVLANPILCGIAILGVIAITRYLQEQAQWETSYENEKTQKMKVVDLSYKAEVYESNIGPTIGMNGKVGVAFTSHHEDERHIVCLRATKGFYRKLVVDSEEVYDSLEEGKTVLVTCANEVKIHKRTKEKREVCVKLLKVNGIENFEFIKCTTGSGDDNET